jgi:transposase
VTSPAAHIPEDIETLRAAYIASQAALAAERSTLIAERVGRAAEQAALASAENTIAHLKKLIVRLQHDRYGASSGRSRKLVDQLESQLAELTTAQSEAKTKAEINCLASTQPSQDAKQDKAPNHPKRAPLPDHLPRERIVLPSPSACPCCSGTLVKLGEDVTETLEVIPRQCKVIQTVREKFACRSCEAITQPPAPFHPIMRGRAGPHLLATILEAKFGQHPPLNRLSETFAREGIYLNTSTIGDWVGASTATIMPLMILIDAHALAAERLHGDDTTVPVLAAGRTDVRRFWTYVRDDAPFGSTNPPAAMFRYSRDRKAIHPERHLANYTGILQADALPGSTGSMRLGDNRGRSWRRRPGRMEHFQAKWNHLATRKMRPNDSSGRRKLFKLAEVHHMPLAVEAVRQIDAMFATEVAINGKPVAERLAVRQRDIAPSVAALEAWMRAERAKLLRHNDLAQAMDYMLKRWEAFSNRCLRPTVFLA